jgi:hypothetical protein
MTRGRVLAATLLGLAILLPACGDDAEAQVPVVQVAAGSSDGEVEYQFDLPERVSAGPTRLDLINRGAEAHHAQVFRLNTGSTLADLEAALATGEPAAALEVGTFVGGTGLVSPGEDSRADAVLELEPGSHVLLCFVPDPTGLPHVAHGMVQPFDVTAPADAPSAPEADVEIDLADYRFDGPASIGGDDTLAITNTSDAEAHEMVMVRGGASIEEITGALDRGEPLPAVAVGGMQAILPGTTQHLQLDLDPGGYVLLCAVTSPDGTRHYDAGMIQEVSVR